MKNAEEIFKILFHKDVSLYTEKKNGLTFLTWSYAWAETMKEFPDATYEILRDPVTQKVYSFDENLGYMVNTSVTINGITRIMWLPVMDSANKAMKNKSYTYKTKYGEKNVEQASMFDINTAIMRCFVKNLAMFGLGLYLYAGEDLPEEIGDVTKPPKSNNAPSPKSNNTPPPPNNDVTVELSNLRVSASTLVSNAVKRNLDGYASNAEAISTIKSILNSSIRDCTDIEKLTQFKDSLIDKLKAEL